MAGKATSQRIIDNDKGTDVWVKKPVTNSSREIRDTILRELFGYTEEDIKQLDIQKKGYFYISDSSKPEEWAIVNHVRDWKPNPNGEVPISMPQTLIDNLITFKSERIAFELNKVLGWISNSELRSSLLQAFQKILTNSGGNRIETLDNILLIIAANPSSANEISSAISNLTGRGGYENNPFLILANAKASSILFLTKSGPGYDIESNLLLPDVKRITTNNFNFGRYKRISSYITRQEAAYINSQLSDIYNRIGASKESKEREWISRFYSISESERISLDEGDVIEILPPGAVAMGTPSPLEKQMNDLNRGMTQRRREWTLMDKGRGIVETNDPRSANRNEIMMDETFNTQTKVWNRKDANKPASQSRPNIYNSTVNQKTTMNSQTIKNINAWGGGIELLLKGLNAKIFNDRMTAITLYLAEKERLQKKIENERQYIVPPKPATLQKIMKDFERNGKITFNPNSKLKIQITLDQLNRLWEESNAFWKN